MKQYIIKEIEEQKKTLPEVEDEHKQSRGQKEKGWG